MPPSSRPAPVSPQDLPTLTLANSDAADRGAETLTLVADLARRLAAGPSVDEMLDHALEFAIEFVPGCEQAGISLVRSNQRIETPASVGSLAAACDRLQEQLREGPCLSAISDSTTIRIDDMQTEQRWPRFAARAAELGVRSLLACQLATMRDRVGALNLYATEPTAFDNGAESLATAYAIHVGLALAALDKESNLRTAMRTRELIGQALGILMERHRLTATQAFDLLVAVSQARHVKLRDLAELLTTTGELPGDAAT